jgi:uncharacterized membrane protein YidH (DUF202 family)
VQPVPIVLAIGGLLLAVIAIWRLYRARHMRNRHEA